MKLMVQARAGGPTRNKTIFTDFTSRVPVGPHVPPSPFPGDPSELQPGPWPLWAPTGLRPQIKDARTTGEVPGLVPQTLAPRARQGLAPTGIA